MVRRISRGAVDKSLLWPGRDQRKWGYGISSHPMIKFPQLRGEKVEEVTVTVAENWEFTYSDGSSGTVFASEQVIEEELRGSDAIVALGWSEGGEEWQGAILVKYPLLVPSDPNLPSLMLTEEHQAFKSPVYCKIQSRTIPWSNPRGDIVETHASPLNKKHPRDRCVAFFSTVFDDCFPDAPMRRKRANDGTTLSSTNCDAIDGFACSRGRASGVKYLENSSVSVSLVHVEGEISNPMATTAGSSRRAATSGAQAADAVGTSADETASNKNEPQPFWTTYFVHMGALPKRRRGKSSKAAIRDLHLSLRGKYLT